MAVTGVEKNYWIEEIRNVLTREQNKLLDENGLEFRKLGVEAAEKWLRDHDLHDAWVDLHDLTRKYNDLKRQLDKAQGRFDGVFHRITEYGVSRISVYGSSTLDDIAVSDEARNIVMEMLAGTEAGREWLRLEDKKNSVRRSIMFATTSVELRAFIRSLCEEIGLSLE